MDNKMTISLQPANENSVFLQMQKIITMSLFYSISGCACSSQMWDFFLDISNVEACEILRAFLIPKQTEYDLNLLLLIKTPDEIIFSHSVAKWK